MSKATILPPLEVDWSAYTPAVIWRALCNAPDIAGPWETITDVFNGETSKVRRAPDYSIIAHVGDVNGQFGEELTANEFFEEYETCEDADAELTDNGWLLVNEE